VVTNANASTASTKLIIRKPEILLLIKQKKFIKRLSNASMSLSKALKLTKKVVIVLKIVKIIIVDVRRLMEYVLPFVDVLLVKMVRSSLLKKKYKVSTNLVHEKKIKL